MATKAKASSKASSKAAKAAAYNKARARPKPEASGRSREPLVAEERALDGLRFAKQGGPSRYSEVVAAARLLQPGRCLVLDLPTDAKPQDFRNSLATSLYKAVPRDDFLGVIRVQLVLDDKTTIPKAVSISCRPRRAD